MSMAPKTRLDLAVGNYISSKAKEKNITQQDLADRAKIPRVTFGKYCRGESSIDYVKLRRVYAILGVTFAEAEPAIDRIYAELKHFRE